MPEYYDPLNNDRLGSLETAKEEKLNRLRPDDGLTYERLPLKSWRDIDSAGFEGITGGLGGNAPDGTRYDKTGKYSLDRLDAIDSFEVYPDTQKGWDYLHNDEYGIRKMALQRQALADKKGLNYEDVTNEDVFEAAATGLVKEAALAQAYQLGDKDYLEQVRAWEPDKELTRQWRTSSPKIDVEALGLEVERAFTGKYGKYGRPLTYMRYIGSDYLAGEEGAGYSYDEEGKPRRKLMPTLAEWEETAQRAEAENMDTLDRMGNAVDAFQRTFAKEVGVDLADWVGEGLNKVTGGRIGWDLGTEEEKTKMVNEFVGFNPYAAEEGYKKAEVHARNIVDAMYDDKKDVSYEDMFELVKIGVTTPEMLGDSVGFIASMFVPFLGWGGKTAKAAKLSKELEKTKAAWKAGKLSKEATIRRATPIVKELKEVREATTVLDKVTGLARARAGTMQVAAGNVNDQIDAYKQEHNEDPSLAKVTQMMVTETLMLSLDRWADVSILKSPAAFKGVKDAFSALSKDDKTKVVAKLASVAGGLTLNMGKEAGQEYLQEIGQEFNVKFNFDDNDSLVSIVDEAGEVLLDKEMQVKGITGAGLGAGGAVQFAAAGVAGRGLVKAGEGAVNIGKAVWNGTEEAPTQEVDDTARDLFNKADKPSETANVASSYYASQGSADEATIAKSREEVAAHKKGIMDGTHTIFSSDFDFGGKLRQLDPIIEAISAEDPYMPLTQMMQAVAARFNPATEEEKEELTKVVTEANERGKQYASIKTILETEAEVSDGSRGFKTYLSGALTAKAEGDEKGYEQSIKNLDRLYNNQAEKLNNIDAAIAKVTDAVESNVDLIISRDPSITREDALRQTRDAIGDKQHKFFYTSRNRKNTPSVSYKAVINKLLYPDGFASDAEIFRMRNTVAREVAAMEKAYNVLSGNISTDEVLKTGTSNLTSSVDTSSSVDTAPSGATTATATNEVSNGNSLKPITDNTISGTVEGINVSNPEVPQQPAVPPVADASRRITERVADTQAKVKGMSNGDITEGIKNLEGSLAKAEKLLSSPAALQNTAARKGIPVEVQTSRVYNTLQGIKATLQVYNEEASKRATNSTTSSNSGSEVELADVDFPEGYGDDLGVFDEGSTDTSEQDNGVEEGTDADLDVVDFPEGFGSDLEVFDEVTEVLDEEVTPGTRQPEEAVETGKKEEGFNTEDVDLPDGFGSDLDVFDEGSDVVGSVIDEDLDLNNVIDEESEDVTKVFKDPKITEFVALKDRIKGLNDQIRERRDELRKRGIIRKEDMLKDKILESLFNEKFEAETELEGKFSNSLKDKIVERIDSFGRSDLTMTVFSKYFNTAKEIADAVAAGLKLKGANSKYVEVKKQIKELFDTLKPTQFTITDRNEDNVSALTRRFADKLVEKSPFSARMFKSFTDNPLNLFLYNPDGSVNYNTVEAVQAAVYAYLERDAGNLLNYDRELEDVAKNLGIAEDKVDPLTFEALRYGGTTLKLAASNVGAIVLDNLGLGISSIQDREAIASMFGIAALEGAEDDFIVFDRLEKAEWMKNSKAGVNFIKGVDGLFDNLNSARDQLKSFEDELGIKVGKERTYRTEKKAKPRKVLIHRAEYLEAPREHQKAVHRQENTAFIGNDGIDVLFEWFKEAKDTEKALVKHIAGDAPTANNADTKERYAAQKKAIERTVGFFMDAVKNVRNIPIYFDWFIAINHRLHLDSNTLNPQTDKSLSRWLYTAARTRVKMFKDNIQKVLENGIEEIDNITEEQKEVLMFAYGIVQAFDGAKDIIGIPSSDAAARSDAKGFPGIDKDDEKAVLAAAKKLLHEASEAELKEMAMNAGHIGHAALAVANIRKFRSKGDTFTSDMVVEIDGLTNGFSFRALQFPLEQEDSPLTAKQWLEKVGFVTSTSSDLYEMESMNEARGKGMEDVYISVGGVLQGEIVNNMESLKPVDRKWVDLFTKHDKLVDFTDTSSSKVKSFIRNLMKAPVMIFNYAAGLQKISEGLVMDQIMGTGYIKKGQGLLDAITEVDKEGNYVITKQELEELFNVDGGVVGTIYHNARVKLANNKFDRKGDEEIEILRNDLTRAVTNLYGKALETTLENLFGRQREVNNVLVESAQFLYDRFKETYDTWRIDNPDATKEDKIEFLRDMTSMLPSVAAAGTDSQNTKLNFLQEALEETTSQVRVSVSGKGTVTTTATTRGYGDMGVGPAVLQVLAADSETLAKTVNSAYRGSTKGGALLVHDAMVLGAGEFDTITHYNTNWYTVNRSYSMIQEVVNAMNHFITNDPDTARNATITDINGEIRTFPRVYKTLVDLNEEVQRNRKELFSMDVKAGQFVGPRGSMAHIKVGKLKNEAVKYIGGMADMIMDKFTALEKDSALKNLLGDKEYNRVINKLKRMLEGCK